MLALPLCGLLCASLLPWTHQRFIFCLLKTRGGCKGLAVALRLWEFCRVQTLWQLLAAAAVAGWVGQ
jgi:hypothetical protein